MNYATRAHSGLAGSVDDGELLRDGFCQIRELLNSAELVSLRTAIYVDLRDPIAESANRRGLLDRSPNIAELAASTRVKALLNELADGSWFAVRAVLFDKTPEANWHVRWHQDQTIAVRKQLEVDGFDGWSEKEGVCHVQAPAEVLENMLSLRLHLDDAGPDNGALQVLPGSHASGKLTERSRRGSRGEGTEILCTARAGDALVMSPLLLHASSIAARPSHRRIIHIDYSCDDLPGELNWHWRL